TLDELNRIYQLYLIYGKLTFSQFSPFPTIEGSLWTGTEYEEMSAARIVAGFAWALNLGVRATGDNFSENFGLASKDMYLGACLIRRVN
ncbi:MAG: hypothetical protein LBD22_06075, partial [Spirochaetaceae bacterium]|nr:hypothetical protein [Spirochaetaceae bacterium]